MKLLKKINTISFRLQQVFILDLEVHRGSNKQKEHLVIPVYGQTRKEPEEGFQYRST